MFQVSGSFSEIKPGIKKKTNNNLAPAIVSILSMVDKYQETSVVIKWRRADISVLGGGRQKFSGSKKVHQVSEMTAVHKHLLTFLMCWEKLKKTNKWWPLQEYGDINLA